MIRRASLIGLAALAVAAPAAGAAGLPPTEVTGVRADGDHGVTVTVRTPGDLGTAGAAVALGDTPALVDAVRPTGPRGSLHLVFAVDTSGSMEGAPIAAAVAAGERLLTSVGEGDRVALVSFDDTVRVAAPLTDDVARVRAALRALPTADGTALYDGVARAIAVAGDDPHARRVVVVLSDGADTASDATTLAALQRLAARSGVEVDAVGLTASDQFVAGPLEAITAAGNGSLVSTASVSDLKPITVRLAQARLSNTYELSVSLPESAARELQVSVRGAPAARIELPEGTSGRAPSPFVEYGHIGIALAAALAVLLAAAARRRRPATLASRLEPYTAIRVRDGRITRPAVDLEGLYRALEERFGERFAWRRVHGLVEQAGLSVPTAQVVVAVAGAAAGLALVGLVLAGPLLALAAAGIAAAAPLAVLHVKAGRRQKRFDEQLPELLGVLSSALRAGRSFPQALDSLVDEAEEPALGEFRRAQHQLRLGVPVEQALDEMSHRLRSESFELVVLTTDVQRRIGGNVAEVFDQVAGTVRTRQQFSARVRALTAMGKMSAYTLVGLPFFLAGVITLLNRGYMAPLYSTGAGHVLIAIGLVMMALGSLVLRRMVRPRAIA